MTETTPATATQDARGFRRKIIGTVTSDKMDKTVVVEVERRVRHAKYGKFVTRRMKYKAHDEQNACNIGDTVRIVETRPLSKDKRWRVAETLEAGREA